ncbi:MAG: tetratricopeptide repeat protein [Planctomycetes bacterium]|nr:tetratricopeptide repeat protein [Planctomycetota bacterium]
MKELLSGVLALVFVCVPLGAAAADSVQPSTGQAIDGQIEEESYSGVTIAIGDAGAKARTSFGWDKVSKITYDDRPSGYDDAEREFAAGDFEKSLADWTKVKTQRPRRVFLQHALVKIAECAEQLRKYDDAVAAYGNLLKEFPNSKWYIQAWKGMVNNNIFKGGFDAALTVIGQGEAEAKAKRDLPPSFPFELGLLKGQVFEAQKKFKEGEAEFKKVSGAAGAQFVDLVHQAKLGQGRCLVEQKSYEDAQKLFREVADKTQDYGILTGAYNGLGDCYLATAGGDGEALKKALFAYLHGVTYWSPSVADPFEFGKSHYFAGRSAQELLKVEQKEEEKEKLRRRARELYQETLDKFGGSGWDDKARAALGTLK